MFRSEDAPDINSKLRDLFDKLPRNNKLLAGCLFLFLSNVAKQSSENKMTTSNLAIVFGQILLRPKLESLESLLRHSPKITNILKAVIENYLAIVPVKLLSVSLTPFLSLPLLDLWLASFSPLGHSPLMIGAERPR